MEANTKEVIETVCGDNNEHIDLIKSLMSGDKKTDKGILITGVGGNGKNILKKIIHLHYPRNRIIISNIKKSDLIEGQFDTIIVGRDPKDSDQYSKILEEVSRYYKI